MDGLILIDKPKGWTSFDVVNKIRHMVEQSGLNTTGKKRFPVGHTGTLDPLATGLLVIVLGNYTKRAPELTKLDKTYEVTMRLGQTSTSGDEEGEKSFVSKVEPSLQEVAKNMKFYRGEIMQTPPAFSAIKINGKRAYKLAREGSEVKIEPRKVTIHRIVLDDYNYPYVQFTAGVSSGTYIRTLVEDIGEKLTTGAYMSDLRRTEVGSFKIDDALKMEGLSAEALYHHVQTLA